jgi:hypothetical protein
MNGSIPNGKEKVTVRFRKGAPQVRGLVPAAGLAFLILVQQQCAATNLLRRLATGQAS